MNKTTQKILLLSALLVVAFISIYWFSSYKKAHKKLLYYSYNEHSQALNSAKNGTFVVGDFSFTNQLGERITQKEVGNAVYVADYFFVSCPGICKKMSSELEKVYTAFKTNPNVKILSHTSLPEEDTTEALMRYAIAHGVTDHNKWLFLTGDKKALYRMARNQYFIVNEKGDGGADDFIHTERFVLIDQHKYIRGYYDGTNEQEVQKLINDIKSLLNEY